MDYKNQPAFKLRRWIINELIDSELIYINDYNGIDPVVPVQDIDELSEKLGSLPYMFYFSIPMPNPNKNNIHMKQEMLYISILANNYTEISAMSSFLVDLLDRADLSAADANQSVTDGSVSFQMITLEDSEEVLKTEQPAGRYVQQLCFSYKYVRPILGNGRSA